MNASSWNDVARLLVVRLDGLGDLLMTGPAISALKNAVPGRTITALVSSAGAACAQLMPDIDDIIVYDAPWMKGTPYQPGSDRAFIDRLRSLGFEGAVLFTVFSQSPLPAALMCHLAGIPRCAAYCRENPYRLITTWLLEREPQDGIRHEVTRQCDLATALGAPRGDDRLTLALRPEAVQWAARWRRPGRPLVVLHPGASAPSRRYPESSYAQVIQLLERELDASCIVTGSFGERDLLWQVKAGARSDCPVLSDLSLERLAALLKSADMVVTNNTGPAHIAAAVGAPVVVLYALTNPQHAPWRARSRVLSADVPCRHCYKSQCPTGHHRCLRDISPRQVVDAVTKLLLGYGPEIRRALC